MHYFKYGITKFVIGTTTNIDTNRDITINTYSNKQSLIIVCIVGLN